MFWKLLIGLASVLPLHMVNGCTCVFEHPQAEFCANTTHFVIKAKVIKEDFLPRNPDITLENDPDLNMHWRKYQVEILNIFKPSIPHDRPIHVDLFTNGNGAMCGVELIKGEVYLISGISDELRLSVNLCSRSLLWSNLTAHQIESYSSGAYKSNCSCMKSKKWCPIPENDTKMCYFKDATCVADTSGICRWQRSSDIRKCLHKHRISRVPETK